MSEHTPAADDVSPGEGQAGSAIEDNLKYARDHRANEQLFRKRSTLGRRHGFESPPRAGRPCRFCFGRTCSTLPGRALPGGRSRGYGPV